MHAETKEADRLRTIWNNTKYVNLCPPKLAKRTKKKHKTDKCGWKPETVHTVVLWDRSTSSLWWVRFTKTSFNPLECKGNYSATLNNMKLVHWPLIDGWAVNWYSDEGTERGHSPPRPLLAVPCVTKNSPSINGQCTDHRIAV